MPADSAHLSSASALLLQGGDDRIRLLDGEQFNKYGCRPYPVSDCIDFGSSTASHVSAQSFALIASLQARLTAAMATSSAEQVYAEELQRLRAEFMRLWGVNDLPGDAAEMIFSASGTDAHLIAARLAETLHGRAVQTVMVQCEETGSGVAAALCGEPFSSRSATGTSFSDYSNAASHRDGLSYVAVRAADGSARMPADVDADFEQAAAAILEQGLPALVVAVDVSKTGISAPSIACLTRLQMRWGSQLSVLIDACQLRLDAAALQTYLQRGCMVAITGSKFFAAPSFCGALLLPGNLAQRLRTEDLPPLLHSYSGRAEWPPAWVGIAGLTPQANFGLLLRWSAALHDMQAFFDIPAETTRRVATAFATAVRQRLQADVHFRLLDNGAPPTQAATIHAFIPCRPQDDCAAQPLSRSETEQLYRRLHSERQSDGHRYLLGQPVQCRADEQQQSWALRLCLSAPMIVQACRAGDLDAAELIVQAMHCLAAVTANIDR